MICAVQIHQLQRRSKFATVLVIAACQPAWTQNRAKPAIAAPSSSPSLTQVLREVENNYNRMKTMKTEFKQLVREGGHTVRVEDGTLWLSKPGRMRWEYQSPEAKLFLTEANRMILYLPAEKRVMQTSVKESDDLRAPLRFLLGRLDFNQEFQRFEVLKSLQPLEAGNIIFKTYPKRLAGQVDSMVFEISPSRQIRRVVINEPGGSETEFRFAGEQANVPVAAEKFRFTPPPGTEIVYQ
jgi:outer membrane lipoprotein carrier protein